MFAKLTIRDFLKIDRADIELNRLTIIGAKNGRGKTSTARALAAVLTGDVQVVKVKQCEYKRFVRRGADNALVRLENADGYYQICWPSGEPSFKGTCPRASSFAVGRTSFLSLDAKAKAETLNKLLETEPTREDIFEALRDIGFDPEATDIYGYILGGWDAAQKKFAEECTFLKRSWEDICKTNFKPKEGAKWLPKNWEPELAEMNLEEIEQCAKAANLALFEAKRNRALDEKEKGLLQELANTLEKRKTDLQEAKANVLSNESYYLQDKTKLESFVVPKRAAELTIYQGQCKHCGEQNSYTFDGSSLREPGVIEGPSEEEINQAIDAREALKREAGISYESWKRAMSVAATAEDELNRAMSARKRLNESGSVSDEQIEALTKEQIRWSDRLEARTQKLKADDMFATVEKFAKLVKMLEPTGLRKQKMLKALGLFNRSLKELCDIAGWGHIQLNSDLEPEIDGEDLLLAAESEKFIVTWAIALTIAKLDKSAIVVLDAADILDVERQSQLNEALKFAGIPAVVLMTANSRDDVPLVHGSSYWIEDGQIERLSTPALVD